MLTQQLVAILTPMIGFRSDELVAPSGSGTLPEELTKTTTGLTVDQCHDLLRLSTLQAAYQKKTDFNAYLGRTRVDAIRALLTTLDTRLAEVGLAPQLMKSKALFAGTAPTTPMIVPTGDTVGYRIRPLQTDVTVTLERLTFSGTYDEGFSLTLTNEDTGETKEIVITGVWQDTSLSLQYGYSYRLTYDETDLGVSHSARNTITQWPTSKPGCKGCLAGCLGHYLAIDSIKITADGTTVTRDTNYGINLVVSAEGDVSGRLVDNPKRILPALKQQMAMSFLEKIAYSNRKNGETEDAIQAALFALTDKDNANRVPVLFDRAVSSLVKSMQAEASTALDINPDDEITWSVL
jgi:hypothetical protein